MARRSSPSLLLRIVDPFVAAGLYLTMLFFRWLPAPIAYGIADLMAVPVVISNRRHERKVEPLGRGSTRNQKIIYRDAWTPESSRKMTRAWARHMTHLFVDFCRQPRITPRNFRRHINCDEMAVITRLCAKGPTVFLTGHIGFWEYTGHVAGLFGIPIKVVARPIPLPLVNRLVNRVRETAGQRVLSKWGVVWALKSCLEQGDHVGIVADESTRDRPVFAPFLGTEASTSLTGVTLHRKLGVPLAVVTCHRRRGRRPRYRFHVWDVIRTEDTRDLDDTALCRRINLGFSRALAAYPEQWFWGSRRFMHRPAGEVPGPDGLPPRTDPASAIENLPGPRDHRV